MSRRASSVVSGRTSARSRESSQSWDLQQQVTAPGEFHLTPSWPQSRIVRQAQTEPHLINLDWDDYLKDLGRNNYGKGRAHSLGSLAIVYVGAKDMGRLLEERYPKAYRNPDHVAELHKKLRKRVGKFITEAYGQVQYEVADQKETAHALVQRSLLVAGFSNELAEDEEVFGPLTTEAGDFEEAPDAVFLSPLPQDTRQVCRAGQLIFGAAVFDAPGSLKPYGKNNYGLDLTLNEQIYEERSGLLRYLHDEEGLNTAGLLRDGWAAHASLFTTEEHLRHVTLEAGLTKPTSMAFDIPRVI